MIDQLPGIPHNLRVPRIAAITGVILMAVKWFIANGDKKRGPVSSKGLRELAAMGNITPGSLIWREGLPDWIPASRIENLFPTRASHQPEPEPEPDPEPERDVRESQSPAHLPDEHVPEYETPVVKWRPAEPVGQVRETSFQQSRLGGHESTARIQWWLLFYAKVNFIISCLITAPILAMGLMIIAGGVAGAVRGINAEHDGGIEVGGLMFGVGLFTGLADIAGGLLLFMLMNVFTLATTWAANVLELLKQQAEAMRE